jgi:hypothetical protein
MLRTRQKLRRIKPPIRIANRRKCSTDRPCRIRQSPGARGRGLGMAIDYRRPRLRHWSNRNSWRTLKTGTLPQDAPETEHQEGRNHRKQHQIDRETARRLHVPHSFLSPRHIVPASAIGNARTKGKALLCQKSAQV